jgi:hypothetical protein
MSKQEEQEIESGAEVLEVVTLSALEATERASIDIQISTAKKYPRSLQAFKKRAIEMATIDEETAEKCLYRRPVGKELNPVTGRMEQKFAEGMSIRMAEIVGACYGNLRVKAFMVEENPRFVKACGQAIDLETNFASSSEAMESCIDKQGRPYSERTRILTGKVALSKARRDATFQVVPRALARPVEAAVRSLLMGDSKTLSKRRELAAGWISKLGIDPKRVYEALGIAGEAELGIDQLETLTGLKTAIKDNETTIDEAFPDPNAPEAGSKKVSGITGAKKEKSDPAATSKPEEKSIPPVADDPAEKKKAMGILEGLMLDLGWSESGTMALAQPQLPKGSKMADLSLAQLKGLIDLASKENKPA